MTNKNNFLSFLFCAACFTSLIWLFIAGLSSHSMPNINSTNQANTIPTVNFAKSIMGL